MAFIIVTKNGEKTFDGKEVVNISSKDGYDYKLDLGFDFLLTIQYDKTLNKCILLNTFDNPKFLFKGVPMGAKIEIDSICKIMVANSDEFITIKMLRAYLVHWVLYLEHYHPEQTPNHGFTIHLVVIQILRVKYRMIYLRVYRGAL